MTTKTKILIRALIIGVILIGGWLVWSNQIYSETREVTITTNKTKYEQGEIIKIIVRNDLNLPIFYSGGERFWFIEKFEDEKWKNLGYERERAFQLPVLENGKEVCYIRVYERPDLIGLESNSEISHAWNQTICPLHRATEQPFEPELIEAGQCHKALAGRQNLLCCRLLRSKFSK